VGLGLRSWLSVPALRAGVPRADRGGASLGWLGLWLRRASPRRGQALLASRDTPARRAWQTALAPPARVGVGVGLVSAARFLAPRRRTDSSP